MTRSGHKYCCVNRDTAGLNSGTVPAILGHLANIPMVPDGYRSYSLMKSDKVSVSENVEEFGQEFKLVK